MYRKQIGFKNASIFTSFTATVLAVSVTLFAFHHRVVAERIPSHHRIILRKTLLQPTPPPFDKRSEEASAVAAQRIIRIQQEINRLPNHEWAGMYYHGDGLGANLMLTLAPESGFVFQWHGCLGLYDQNYGPVAESPSGLRLLFTFPNKTSGFEGVPDVLIPIRWGNRHYLIAPGEMQAFCNEVNAGSEARTDIHGLFFLKTSDVKKAVSGTPNVPLDCRKYLLPKPVSARIIFVQSSKVSNRHFWQRSTHVTLDVGSSDGQYDFANYAASVFYASLSRSSFIGHFRSSDRTQCGPWSVRPRWINPASPCRPEYNICQTLVRRWCEQLRARRRKRLA